MVGTATNILYLAGTNSYTGNTVVQAGRVTLLSTGSISNSPVISIASGASLDVQGVPGGFGLAPTQTLAGSGFVLGAVSDNAGATIQPGGLATFGTLAISNNVTLNGGGTLLFDLNSAATTEGAGVNDLLNVSNLTVNAPTTIRLNPLSGAFIASGTYTLINYSGTLTGQGNFSVVTDMTGATATLDFNTVGKILVNVVNGSSVPLVWLGDLDFGNPIGKWDNAITFNWYDGGGQALFTPGSAVTFNDDFNNSPTVNLIGSLAPASIVVSSFDNQFSFIGSGSLGGGGLAKAGQSTMTLANSGVNNWTGPTDLRAGALRVGNGGTVGALPGTIITNNGTLIFNRADNMTVANTLVGTGATIQQGPGNLLLSGNSSASYIGGLYVYGGTLAPSSPLALGATNLGSAAITVAGGGTLDLNGQNFGSKPVLISGTGVGGLGAVVNSGAAQTLALQYLSLAGDATIGGLNRWDVRGPNTAVTLAGSTLTKTGLNNIYFVQSVIGDGNIVLNQGVLGFEVGATATNSPGSNGVIVANGGTLGFGNWGARLNIARSIVMSGGIFQAESGGTDLDLDSPITLATNTLFDIIIPARLTNVISGPGRLTKGNSSTLVLAGPNTYSGGTVVSGGVLQIGTNGGGSITGDIANNATVQFGNASPVTFPGSIIGSAGVISHYAGAGPLAFTGTNVAAILRVQSANPENMLTLGGTSSNIFGALSVGITNVGIGPFGSGGLRIEPGAKVTVNTSYYLGDQNTQTGVVVQAGGDIAVAGQFRVGHWPNNVSTYLMGGGTLAMTTLPASNPAGSSTAEQSGGFYIGIDGVGFFTQTGGVVTTHGLVMDNRGSSTLGGFVNTYALEGGTLALGAYGIQSGGASAANQNTAFNLYLGGGTVSSISNWTSPLAMNLTGTNGNVTIDTGLFTNTLNGILSGNGGLTKNGAGTLILGGNNTYFGATLINNGTLVYNGTLPLGAGTVTIGPGATLSGSGTINAPVVLAPSSIMAPGTSIGTLTLNSGPITLPVSTVMEISKQNATLTNDVLRTTSALTYGGTLTIVVLANVPAFAAGDMFRLFDAPGYVGAFGGFNLPALTPGLAWDTSKLSVDGTISVAALPFIVSLTPLTQTVQAGSPATFTVVAGGTSPLTYQWYFGANPIGGANGPVLNIANAQPANTGSYSVVVANAVGSATGGPATLNVVDTTPPNLTCPANITLDCDQPAGRAVSFSVTVTDNLDSGLVATCVPASGSVFPPGVTTVNCSATDSSNNVGTCSFTITINETVPAFLAQAQSRTNNVGASSSFSALVSGCTTLSYQWSLNGAPITDATNTTYTIPTVSLADAGSYVLKVSSHFGSITSAVAVLTVNRLPVALPNGGTALQGRTTMIALAKLLLNDSDADGDVLTVTGVSVTSTNGGAVMLSGGFVFYTPLPAFIGNDLFTYTISDGRGGTATGNVEMYVSNSSLPGANQIAIQVLANGHVLVRFAGVPGRSYQVQRSPDLAVWTTLATQVAPAHGIIAFEDTAPPMGGAFYRIALP